MRGCNLEHRKRRRGQRLLPHGSMEILSFLFVRRDFPDDAGSMFGYFEDCVRICVSRFPEVAEQGIALPLLHLGLKPLSACWSMFCALLKFCENPPSRR